MIIDTYISLTKGNHDREYVSTMIESLISLGYGSAFFVTEIENREIEEDDRWDPSLFIHCLTKLQQTAFVKSDKITQSNEFVPYSRLSFTASKRNILNSYKSPIASSFDIISCRPLNQDTFDHACKSSFIDIIEIPLNTTLPFKVTKEAVDDALKNGIFFEFTYGPSLIDRSYRRFLFSSSINLITYTRGNNILLGSDCQHPMEIKSPYDLITIASLMNIPFEKATAVIYKNPISVLNHAQKRKMQKGILIE